MSEESDTEVQDYTSEDLTSAWNTLGLLKTLQHAFGNSLTDASPKASQPSAIKLPMKAHQLALLSAMKDRESASIQGIRDGSMSTYTNYGILGDAVGTGKSLVVLGHIAQMKESGLNQYSRKVLHPLSTPTFFSIYEKKYSDTSGNTLIVVPHTLFRQWQTYCKAQTSLNIFFVKTAKSFDLSGNELRDTIAKSDATLISNTLYSDLIRQCTDLNIKWRRVFWDEADSIHITSTSIRPSGCFHWFVTATWPNFLLSGFMLRPILLNTALEQGENKYHPDMMKWLRQEIGLVNYQLGGSYAYGRVTWLRSRSMNFWRTFRTNHSRAGITVLRTSNAFLEISRTMPSIIDTILRCKQSAVQRIVSDFVSPEIQNMLHAGDIETVLTHLGVSVDTPMSLLDAVTSQRNKELLRLKQTLAFRETQEYAQAKTKEEAIQKLKVKIESLEAQNKALTDRLAGLKDELCPICYEEPKATTLTPCCSHIFCGACVLASLSRTPTCPLCRTPIQPNQLTWLTDETTKKDKKKSKKKKSDAEPDESLPKPKRLLKFLKENPSARVLVFSRYENPFSGLAQECEEAGITYTILKGNKDCIANTIKNFEAGVKRVLFLPTQTAGAGMNLVGATHVVIYHAMTPEDEHQVIGRAYRLGRTEPLNVVRLLHEGETFSAT